MQDIIQATADSNPQSFDTHFQTLCNGTNGVPAGKLNLCHDHDSKSVLFVHLK